MILVIDVTVTGPDWVGTGSAAVTVNTAPAQSPAPPSAEDAPLLQQRSQALMMGYPRA